MRTLKEKRLEKGLTQKELAKMLNVFPERIPLLESCTHHPNPGTRRKLTAIFGTLDFSTSEKYKPKPKSRLNPDELLKDFITSLFGFSDEIRINMIDSTIERLKKLK